MISTGLLAGQLTGPFSRIVDEVVTDSWLRNFLDLECFVLSGMLAKDTICAEMAFMFMERNESKSTIDYPKGGSGAIVDALVRGIEKNGGQVLLSTPVEQVLVENGRASGVRIKSSRGSSEIVKARKAVVSNASVWDTAKLLPEDSIPPTTRSEMISTPRTGSFMHLHLGIDASNLPSDLELSLIHI